MIEWRKSSRSNASGEECVEVAAPRRARHQGQHGPDADHLTLTTTGFTQLLTHIKQDQSAA